MKKASLQLSINAIVIIILAITLLGLGLGFIRTFMGKGTEQFTTIIEGVEMENPATANDPITLPRNVVVEGGGRKGTIIDIGFYCDKAGGCGKGNGVGGVKPFFLEDSEVTDSLTCEGVDDSGALSTIEVVSDKDSIEAAISDPSFKGVTLLTVPSQVDAHDNIGFRATLTSYADTAGQYVCTIIIADSGAAGKYLTGKTTYTSKQIFLTLT